MLAREDEDSVLNPHFLVGVAFGLLLAGGVWLVRWAADHVEAVWAALPF